MVKTSILLLCWAIAVIDSTTQLTLYYDVEPISNRLFFRQNNLIDVYDKLESSSSSSSVSFDFVPHGNATVPHGNRTKAAFANRVHSCALSQLSDEREKIFFVGCTMRLIITTSILAMHQCVRDLNVTLDYLRSCSKSSLGHHLLEENAKKTRAAERYIKKFPALLFADGTAAEENLYDTIVQRL